MGNKFDELNEKGYVRISSKAKQPLEVDTTPIRVSGPKQAYEVDTAPVLVRGNPPQIAERTYTKVKAEDKFAKALESHLNPVEIDAQNLKRAFRQGSDVVGKFRGGKLAALAALGTLGYQAFKGEPVQAAEAFKAGAEALNPLPFSLEEINEEMSKNKPIQKLEELQLEKEHERELRENAARPGALEFGSRLKSAMKKGSF